MTEPKPIISIQQVCKSFHGQKVLDNIDLDVHAGEFLTLLGASGCGKTTLLRILSGFEQVDSGQVFLNGENLAGIPPNHRHVNTVFQSYALFPHLSVFDNVAFGLRCQKLPKKVIKEKVEAVLKRVQLSNLAKRKPKQLSGGQQQRVAIARAIVNEPLVLLLDEPLGSLDYQLRKELQLELKHLQRQLNMTFIFVTHDQEEALSMSDRVALMDAGRIIQLDTPRQVYENPNSLQVAKFIGAVNCFDTELIENLADKLVVNIENKRFTLDKPDNYQGEVKLHTLIRPEDLKVWGDNEVKDKDTAHMFKAVVEDVIYKGSTVDLILKLASGKKLAATEFFDEDDENLDYQLGENVWAEWYPGWEVILAE